jgi:hypothetical protein
MRNKLGFLLKPLRELASSRSWATLRTTAISGAFESVEGETAAHVPRCSTHSCVLAFAPYAKCLQVHGTKLCLLLTDKSGH